MTPLQETIRRSLLSYPTIYRTGWDVLDHMFLSGGNGLEWGGGRIVEIGINDPFDEAEARARFFRGIDETDSDHPPSKIDLIERKYRLENIDLYAACLAPDEHARRLNHRSLFVRGDTYWLAYCVPDDVEPSFKEGAIKALDGAAYLLRKERDSRYHPMIERIMQHYDVLTNDRRNKISRLVKEALADSEASLGASGPSR